MRNKYIDKGNFSMKKFNNYDKIGIYYNHLWKITIALISNEGVNLIPIFPSSRWAFNLPDDECVLKIIGVDV